MAPVIAPSTSTTRACSRSMLVSELSACEADRMPSRSSVPVVTAARPCGRRRAGRGATPAVGSGGGRRVGVGPVELVDLRGRAPGEVLLAGLGEQLVAGVVEAVGEVEAGRALGDQGPVPGPLARRRPRAGRRRRRGRRRGSRRPPRPARPRAAAAGAGSCPARPRRGRPASRVTSSSSDSSAARSSPWPARACPARANPRSSRATAVG